MYRYSQTLPGGPITLVGIIALSFLIPGWTAGALGWATANAQLVGWIFSHQGILCLALVLLYGLGGFALLVGASMAIYVGYFVLIRALVTVRNWAVRTSVAAAQANFAGIEHEMLPRRGRPPKQPNGQDERDDSRVKDGADD